jgi:hypothetical protein
MPGRGTGDPVLRGVAMNWSDQTLDQLEGVDWGEPTFSSYVVTNAHQLRKKTLREFTPEDLRFMLGQQISLPILMPMALDLLETNPFTGGDMSPGSLLCNALRVEPQFWRAHSDLWYRLNAIVVDVDLHELREFIERELIPAAGRFQEDQPDQAT